MLIDIINELIPQVTKSGNKTRLNTIKAIKQELVKFSTAKENIGKPITKEIEDKILLKMVAQTKDAINQFMEGNREDLATQATAELVILNEFAPKVASIEEITSLTEKIIKEKYPEVSMKDMKAILTEVQATYSTADGKIVSSIVRKYC